MKAATSPSSFLLDEARRHVVLSSWQTDRRAFLLQTLEEVREIVMQEEREEDTDNVNEPLVVTSDGEETPHLIPDGDHDDDETGSSSIVEVLEAPPSSATEVSCSDDDSSTSATMEDDEEDSVAMVDLPLSSSSSSRRRSNKKKPRSSSSH
jgi:hypothetical protein